MANEKVQPVVWSARSLKQVSKIQNYLLTKFAEKEVADLFDLLTSFEETVSGFPKLYQKFSFRKKLRRAVLNKNLSVYYTIRKQHVFVVSVLDNRMGFSTLL